MSVFITVQEHHNKFYFSHGQNLSSSRHSTYPQQASHKTSWSSHLSWHRADRLYTPHVSSTMLVMMRILSRVVLPVEIWFERTPHRDEGGWLQSSSLRIRDGFSSTPMLCSELNYFLKWLASLPMHNLPVGRPRMMSVANTWSENVTGLWGNTGLKGDTHDLQR